MRTNSIVPVLLAAFVVCFATGRATADDPLAPNERIAAVENGLIPSVRIKGRTARGTIGERMKARKVPGVSVAVINDYKIEWAKGYGLSDAASSVPVTTDTLFQAASISKPISALAALKLVEDGALDLDRDVNEKLTSWKVPDNKYTREHAVDLRALLSHTAGLNVSGFPGYAADAPLPRVVDILDGKKPANTAPVRVTKVPGKGFRYAGGGTVVVQQLLIDVTGRPFPELLHALVLDPLEMKASRFDQPLVQGAQSLAASAHDARGNPITGRWHVYPELSAAGLWTTPSDLARYVIEIQLAHEGKSAKVLSREPVEGMLTPQGGGPVGLGPFLEQTGHAKRFWHGGHNLGFSCQFVGYLDRGQGAVVMTNSDAGRRIVDEVLNSIATVYHWPEYLPPERELNKLDSDALDRFTGRYDLGLLGTATLTRHGDRLLAKVSDGSELEVYLEDDNKFFTDERDVVGTFETDERGQVIRLVLNALGETVRAKRLPQ